MMPWSVLYTADRSISKGILLRVQLDAYQDDWIPYSAYAPTHCRLSLDKIYC
jgi:hypothetical protein